MHFDATWVGIHDHADTAPRWLDARVSYTWLRAFERLAGTKPVAYLREPHYDNDLEVPVRGVHYRFRTGGIERWVADIVSDRPSLILYNVCYYREGAPALQYLRDALPHAVHVVRIHHQVNYLAAHTGFAEFVRACDVAIAPTASQVQHVRDLGFTGPIYNLPFGVNLATMRKAARCWGERDIQLASAANSHPARNLELVESIYDKLRQRGRRVENFQGLSPQVLAERLGRTRIFWQTSMTEASGSRILPEAMAAGCYPVVFTECASTCELIAAHGVGTVLQSGIRYDFSTKTTTYPDGIADRLADELDALIARIEAGAPYREPDIALDYDERHEVAQLAEILRKCQAVKTRAPVITRRGLPLPVDDGGYAFNPAICRTTDTGLLCIYRHVDQLGRRTLRRAILDEELNASSVAIWSDEMRERGCTVEWYADPRIFQMEDRFFLSFNTGHSEAPNNIYMVRIDADGAPISDAYRVIKSNGRREFEKNWGFFGYGGEVYAIYSIAPFVVLKIRFEDGEAIADPFSYHEWDASAYETHFGELHGGAPPLLLADRGLFIAQSNVSLAGRRIYRGTMVTFEPHPPFRPLAFAEKPLFQLSISECGQMPQTKLNPSITECLYPSAALVDEASGTLTIGYGINDFRIGIRTYSLMDLEARLTTVSPPSD
jgi:hypothetical protein